VTPEEIEALEPVYIGPTWLREEDGRWFLPEHTLGWEIIGWAGKWLRGEDGKPWTFTPEQMRLLLWWYAIDKRGRFIYRKGIIQRMKGWGKDPLLAVICLVELVGPSRFSHWENADGSYAEPGEGEPVGMPVPRAWVQVTAVNQSQTDNTMEFIPSLMSDEFIAHYGIKDGAELIRAQNGTRKPRSGHSSYRAIEGKRTTFVLLNETHHWVEGNHGLKMYETIDGNATKRDARYMAITNAYLPGEDSVAQKMRESYDKVPRWPHEGRRHFLRLRRGAPARLLSREEALMIVIPKIRGDAVWLRPETIIQSIQDGDMSQAARGECGSIRSSLRRTRFMVRPNGTILEHRDARACDQAMRLFWASTAVRPTTQRPWLLSESEIRSLSCWDCGKHPTFPLSASVTAPESTPG
jgi:hypothetical protein